MMEVSLENLICNLSETSLKMVALFPSPMAVKDLVGLDKLCSQFLNKQMEGRYNTR